MQSRVIPMWEEKLRVIRRATVLHTHCDQKWVIFVVSHDIAEAIKGTTGHEIDETTTFETIPIVIEPTLPYGTAFLISRYVPEGVNNA